MGDSYRRGRVVVVRSKQKTVYILEFHLLVRIFFFCFSILKLKNFKGFFLLSHNAQSSVVVTIRKTK